MSVSLKLPALFAVTALLSFATTSINIPGPTTPAGVPCLATDPTCVKGDPALYAIYGVQLTQNTATNWTLNIETNYPAKITGNTIPNAQWGVDLQFYSISDFLIHWNGQDYGVVLSPHIKAGNTVDSYVGGNLYQAPNTQFDLVLSGTNNTIPLAPGVIPQSPRPDGPVWLAPGGTQLGTGTVTVAQGGNGTPAAYTITDQFTAPVNFLSAGDFQITASSWVCFNGVIVGGGTGGTAGGTGGQVPEPGTFLLSLPVLLLFARRLRQKRI
jgi:hypothetical protein